MFGTLTISVVVETFIAEKCSHKTVVVHKELCSYEHALIIADTFRRENSDRAVISRWNTTL